MWSGMTLTDARQIWAREQPGLARVSVEGWREEVLRDDLDALARAGTGAEFDRPVVRLLPYFDTFLLGHMQRDHLMEREHQPKVYRAQGWIAPVVLIDGRAAAAWEYAMEGVRLRVKVTGFGEIPMDARQGIAEEAAGLGRFLGATTVDVHID